MCGKAWGFGETSATPGALIIPRINGDVPEGVALAVTCQSSKYGSYKEIDKTGQDAIEGSIKGDLYGPG